MLKTGGWRLIAVLAAPALLAVLVACSAPPASVRGDDDEKPTANTVLFEAKRLILAVQDDVVSLLPRDNVASIDKETKAALLSCDKGFLWPGGTRVELEGTIDQQSVVDSAGELFDGEWAVGPSPIASAMGFSLSHDDGRELTAVFSADASRFTVTAFSSCFPFEPESGKQY